MAVAVKAALSEIRDCEARETRLRMARDQGDK
jgi:heme exporter protein D